MISVDLLIHTLPNEKGKPVHQEIINEDYQNLSLNDAGIFNFLVALDENFPGTLDDSWEGDIWLQAISFNRYCVQLPCHPRAINEIFTLAKPTASAQGLCLYRFDEDRSYYPDDYAPEPVSKDEKLRLERFFSEIEEWNNYSKLTAKLPYVLEDKIEIVSKQASDGVGPAMRHLAQLLAFKARHKDTAKMEAKLLLENAFKYADAVKDKAYSKGIKSSVLKTAKKLGFEPSEF